MTAVFLVLALLLAPVGPLTGDLFAVTAADKARAEAHALEAKFKFKAEDYSGAASLFLQAFTVSRSPALLYNAARAFEEAGKLKQARAAFEQYLSLRGVSASGRADAKGKIAALNKRITAGAASKQQADAAQRQAAADKARVDAARADRARADRARADRALADNTARDGKAAPGKDAGQPGVHKGGTPTSGNSSTVTWALMGGGAGAALLGMILMANGSNAQTSANEDTDWGAENAKANYVAASESASATWGGGFLLMAAGLGFATWGVLRWRAAGKGAQASSGQLNLTPALLKSHVSGESAPGMVLGGRF